MFECMLRSRMCACSCASWSSELASYCHDTITYALLLCQVAIWDVGAVRQLVATLRVPPEFGSRRSVTSIAWSSNSRLLFAGTSGGYVHVWSVTTADGGLLIRTFIPPMATIVTSHDGASSTVSDKNAFAAPVAEGLQHAATAIAIAAQSTTPSQLAPTVVRFIRPHPVDAALLLLVPWAGMPWLVDWMAGTSWQVRLAACVRCCGCCDATTLSVARLVSPVRLLFSCPRRCCRHLLRGSRMHGRMLSELRCAWMERGTLATGARSTSLQHRDLRC